MLRWLVKGSGKVFAVYLFMVDLFVLGRFPTATKLSNMPAKFVEWKKCFSV